MPTRDARTWNGDCTGAVRRGQRSVHPRSRAQALGALIEREIVPPIDAEQLRRKYPATAEGFHPGVLDYLCAIEISEDMLAELRELTIRAGSADGTLARVVMPSWTPQNDRFLITHLEGIQSARRLELLGIEDTVITDFSPLLRLRALKWLRVDRAASVELEAFGEAERTLRSLEDQGVELEVTWPRRAGSVESIESELVDPNLKLVMVAALIVGGRCRGRDVQGRRSPIARFPTRCGIGSRRSRSATSDSRTT
jgi:hypothetical protein